MSFDIETVESSIYHVYNKNNSVETNLKAQFSCKMPKILENNKQILDQLTDLVKETFESAEDTVKDGMDGALCSIDLKNRTIAYAGANNPLWIVKEATGELLEIKADKQPIGEFEFRKPFTNHNFSLDPGDTIFIFSDGYVDQFGGPRGKKFKYKTLKQLLVNNRKLSMSEHKTLLNKTFEDWRKDIEQLDDVCVIGVRF